MKSRKHIHAPHAKPRDRGIGYTANAESQHSRRAARGGERPLGMVPPRSTVHRLIARHESELRQLQKRLNTETDPAKRAKLQRDAGIKQRFLARLYAERKAS